MKLWQDILYRKLKETHQLKACWHIDTDWYGSELWRIDDGRFAACSPLMALVFGQKVYDTYMRKHEPRTNKSKPDELCASFSTSLHEHFFNTVGVHFPSTPFQTAKLSNCYLQEMVNCELLVLLDSRNRAALNAQLRELFSKQGPSCDHIPDECFEKLISGMFAISDDFLTEHNNYRVAQVGFSHSKSGIDYNTKSLGRSQYRVYRELSGVVLHVSNSMQGYTYVENFSSLSGPTPLKKGPSVMSPLQIQSKSLAAKLEKDHRCVFMIFNFRLKLAKYLDPKPKKTPKATPQKREQMPRKAKNRN